MVGPPSVFTPTCHGQRDSPVPPLYMSCSLRTSDVVGLIHPSIDAHTLGVSSITSLLASTGITVHVAGAEVCNAALEPMSESGRSLLKSWIRDAGITVLGFSYRLDPVDAVIHLGRLLTMLKAERLFGCVGARIRSNLFAGLPEACARVRAQFPEISVVFQDDETPSETLASLGLSPTQVSPDASAGISYDDDRLAFAKEMLQREAPAQIAPVARTDTYVGYGTRKDSLVLRLDKAKRRGVPPLMRAHVGPYHPDRGEALRMFGEWCRDLASGGYLDVLSIGTSQLSQSDFGGDWSGKSDGGGVPIHSAEEFSAIYDLSRPMLLRFYAGSLKVPSMARMLEKTINTACHALSLWWFASWTAAARTHCSPISANMR